MADFVNFDGSRCYPQNYYGSTIEDDSDSSDEEEEEFTLLNQDQEILADRSSHLLYRGVHFSPNYFNSSARQETRKREHHATPVYSLATQFLASRFNGDYRKADELVKGYFELLKIAADKPEFDTDTRRSAPRKKDGGSVTYDSLFTHFVQAYVTTYGKLFAQGGMTRNFNFAVNRNPILSTSKEAVPAAHFAGGHFITKEARYFPKVKLFSNGLKHRRLGYVHVYCVNAEYYTRYAIDIPSLIGQRIIGVDYHHRHASEIAFQSSIPEEFVVGYQIIALPKMKGKWTSAIQSRYGLSYEDYYKFKNNLGSQEHLALLIEKVVAFQASRLKECVLKVVERARKIQKLSEDFASVRLGSPSMTSLETPQKQLEIDTKIVFGPFRLSWSSNSCYLDSVLQALFIIRRVQFDLRNDLFDPNDPRYSIREELLHFVTGTTQDFSSMRNVLRERIFQSGLSEEFTPKTQFHQHDVAELIQFLISNFFPNYQIALKETVTTNHFKGLEFYLPEHRHCLFTVPLPAQREESCLEDLFQEALYEEIREEWDCNPKDGHASVCDGLPILSVDEKQRLQEMPCTKVMQRVSQRKLNELPEIFCIQVMRFSAQQKNQARVSLPPDGLVYITEQGIVSCENYRRCQNFQKGLYKIKSLIVHQGQWRNEGHYIAYVELDNEYYCCDDRKGNRRIKREEFLQVKESYVIVLQRIHEKTIYNRIRFTDLANFTCLGWVDPQRLLISTNELVEILNINSQERTSLFPFPISSYKIINQVILFISSDKKHIGLYKLENGAKTCFLLKPQRTIPQCNGTFRADKLTEEPSFPIDPDGNITIGDKQINIGCKNAVPRLIHVDTKNERVFVSYYPSTIRMFRLSTEGYHDFEMQLPERQSRRRCATVDTTTVKKIQAIWTVFHLFSFQDWLIVGYNDNQSSSHTMSKRGLIVFDVNTQKAILSERDLSSYLLHEKTLIFFSEAGSISLINLNTKEQTEIYAPKSKNRYPSDKVKKILLLDNSLWTLHSDNILHVYNFIQNKGEEFLEVLDFCVEESKGFFKKRDEIIHFEINRDGIITLCVSPEACLPAPTPQKDRLKGKDFFARLRSIKTTDYHASGEDNSSVDECFWYHQRYLAASDMRGNLHIFDFLNDMPIGKQVISIDCETQIQECGTNQLLMIKPSKQYDHNKIKTVESVKLLNLESEKICELIEGEVITGLKTLDETQYLFVCESGTMILFNRLSAQTQVIYQIQKGAKIIDAQRDWVILKENSAKWMNLKTHLEVEVSKQDWGLRDCEYREADQLLIVTYSREEGWDDDLVYCTEVYRLEGDKVIEWFPHNFKIEEIILAEHGYLLFLTTRRAIGVSRAGQSTQFLTEDLSTNSNESLDLVGVQKFNERLFIWTRHEPPYDSDGGDYPYDSCRVFNLKDGTLDKDLPDGFYMNEDTCLIIFESNTLLIDRKTQEMNQKIGKITNWQYNPTNNQCLFVVDRTETESYPIDDYDDDYHSIPLFVLYLWDFGTDAPQMLFSDVIPLFDIHRYKNKWVVWNASDPNTSETIQTTDYFANGIFDDGDDYTVDQLRGNLIIIDNQNPSEIICKEFLMDVSELRSTVVRDNRLLIHAGNKLSMLNLDTYQMTCVSNQCVKYQINDPYLMITSGRSTEIFQIQFEPDDTELYLNIET